jgi:hypothetical protein
MQPQDTRPQVDQENHAIICSTSSNKGICKVTIFDPILQRKSRIMNVSLRKLVERALAGPFSILLQILGIGK